MKKKVFIMLPCIAAVAIATFVGKKTFEKNAFDSNAMLTQNVEALSQGDDGIEVADCYEHGGEGEYKSVYECNSKTSTNHIYKCPDRTSFFVPGLRGTCYK